MYEYRFRIHSYQTNVMECLNEIRYNEIKNFTRWNLITGSENVEFKYSAVFLKFGI